MKFLNDPKTKTIATVALAVLSVGLLGYVVVKNTVFAETSLEALSKQRTAIDGESRKVYQKFFIPEGSSYPWKNPDTGKNTIYPAEFCYWTKDGKAKLEPTIVLLNEFIGKKEKTICPDCGRTVVPHNGMPPMELMKQAAIEAGIIKPDGQ